MEGAQSLKDLGNPPVALGDAFMDTVRGLDDRLDFDSDDATEAAMADDRTLNIGTDERRMHVRAYNYWVSLLGGRAYPSIEDLDPENLADFGPNSVLLDFTGGIEDPVIRFLGRALREECGVGAGITRIAEVPSRSLLSRLTDHYLQIIANRAPIGFEAEFVSQRGNNTMYRGILMPFSSNDDSIDFIYGVINWKELVDAETQAKLNAELEQARRATPRAAPSTAVWADGPSGGFEAAPDSPAEPEVVAEEAPVAEAGLADRLMLARETAAAVRAADTRSRAALYRALGRAYDFALAADADRDGYLRLLAETGIAEQARAPMTPIVKLVFGSDYDKARVTEFAAVLSYAKRETVVTGGLAACLDGFAGGIKAVVKAERAARRPAPQPDAYDRAAHALRAAPAIAHVPIGAEGEEFVVLLARPGAEGQLDVIARVETGRGLLRQVVRHASA